MNSFRGQTIRFSVQFIFIVCDKSNYVRTHLIGIKYLIWRTNHRYTAPAVESNWLLLVGIRLAWIEIDNIHCEIFLEGQTAVTRIFVCLCGTRSFLCDATHPAILHENDEKILRCYINTLRLRCVLLFFFFFQIQYIIRTLVQCKMLKINEWRIFFFLRKKCE